ncbi:hypothetical protein ABEY65_28305 [Priestia aryabhattai]|uniref:hypothetical protein n=1 Tax=Priestia aryabhattai TaxID=412384 RepID=UPI003D2D53AB
MEFTLVDEYINSRMFYKEPWDEITAMEDADRIKQVVVNNAEDMLKRELPHHFDTGEEIPVDVMAEQCMHVISRDDSHRRAEAGVSYFMASGLYLSFDKNFKEWGIAPSVLRSYPKRRTAQYGYSRRDTFRTRTVIHRPYDGKTRYDG